MRPAFLISLFLIINLCVAIAEDDHSTRPNAKRRRMLKRRRRVSTKDSPGKEKLIKPSPIPIPVSKVQLFDPDDTVVHTLKAVEGLSEQAPSYSILPVRKGHCTVNGMVMYDKAVWSPKPCLTCMCSNGKAICDETTCPLLTCPMKVIHEGECCPACSDIVLNSFSLGNRLEFSGDSPEPNDPGDLVLAKSPKTQEEMDELLRREEEEREEEEERIEEEKRRKKKNKEERKRQAEKERQMLKEKEEAIKREEEEQQRKANEEEELRIEEEEQRKKEEKKKKEEEDKRDEELNQLARERKQRQREEQEREEEEEDEEEEDENDILRGDVFRIPARRIPGPRRTEKHHPPLPPGCFISEITVSCSNAKLTRIPPISDPDLKSLDLLGNFITSIPHDAFNGLPNLEMIDLTKNKILSTGIDALAFKSLKNLKRLYLDGNLLDQVPSNLPFTLEEFKLNENKIGGLKENSLQDLKNLVTLELEGNQLNEGNVNPLAFKPLQRLSYMRLGRNKFRTIPQGLPTSIEELHLENNDIEEISETSFNHTINLNTVVLRHNKIDETRIAPLAWILHENLESIDLSYNKLYHVPSYLPKSLLHLVLVGNEIERIPGYVFAHLKPGLEYLYLSFNKLDNDGMDPISFHGAYHSLREIFLDHNDLKSVPVGMEDMKDLHILRLNNNKIRSVSEHCICSSEDGADSHLEYLHLENNYINTREISPYAFSCISSYSSIILKPQKVK